MAAVAGITAAASLFQGITAGKGAKKAAKIAAQSAAADRAQALQIYNTNMGLAQPAVDRGNAAGAQANALLGLGGDTTAANDALAAYKASTGYAGRLQEGYNAVNTGYAARGALESGAAQKAILAYGQQQASGEFNNYLGQLNNQQSAGLNALGQVTGAGASYANQVSNANASQSSAQANAALYSSLGQQNALAGVANAAGQYFGRAQVPQFPAQNALAGVNSGSFVYGGSPYTTPPYRSPFG